MNDEREHCVRAGGEVAGIADVQRDGVRTVLEQTELARVEGLFDWAAAIFCSQARYAASVPGLSRVAMTADTGDGRTPTASSFKI